MISGKDLFDLSIAGAPLARQRDALRAALAERGVGDEAAAIVMAFVRDGVGLSSRLPVGRTRLGGSAVLPEGVPWPRLSGASSEWHLGFLLEVHLAELPSPTALAPDGTLLVFQDMELFGDERDPLDATRVFYVPEGGRVWHPDPPEKLLWPLPAKRLGARALPVPGDAELTMRALPASARDAVVQAMQDLFAELWTLCDHWLLGAAMEVQGPVLEELPRILADAPAATRARFSTDLLQGVGWILLAQLGGEYDRSIGLDFAIGDGGNLYLLIPEQDLASLRFDRVVGFMQTH